MDTKTEQRKYEENISMMKHERQQTNIIENKNYKEKLCLELEGTQDPLYQEKKYQ